MTTDVTFPAALAAGLLSFLSPCVLPLAPPYLTYIAGATIEDLAGPGRVRARRDVALAGLVFVLGFSTVFVTLGATASAFGAVARAHLPTLSLLAGLAIIAMGLHFLGFFRLAFLYREKRLDVAKPLGLWGAYVMGLAFAFGWTPCIGPVLAAILAVAGAQESVGRGAALLFAYSLGLGIPFFAAALAIEPLLAFSRGFARYYVWVERAMGGLLVATGIAFLTGATQSVSFWLIEAFPSLAKLG